MKRKQKSRSSEQETRQLSCDLHIFYQSALRGCMANRFSVVQIWILQYYERSILYSLVAKIPETRFYKKIANLKTQMKQTKCFSVGLNFGQAS